MENTPAGWYLDPSGDTTKLRYWNGAQWTSDCTDTTTPTSETTPCIQPEYNRVAYPQESNCVDSSDQTLRLVAFVFCIISTVSVGWLIIPLIWMVPMSVHCWGIYKGTKPNTVAFAVCTLIFLDFVSGILLLVSKKN